jgi:hypothetical protein
MQATSLRPSLVYVSDQLGTTMERTEEKQQKSTSRSVYDLSTPLIDKYLRQMRRHIRFPRYYKKALNW